MARQRLTDAEIQAIRAERAQAGQVIETLRQVLAVPGVTSSHPQLAPFVSVLLANPQVPKLTWFSAIRFQGYDAVLAARYPGAESVAIAMRDASRKGGYAPVDRLEWQDFKAAVSRGLTHDEWVSLMGQLPELPKRERRVNEAAAKATSLMELLTAQAQPRDDDDDDEEREPLTPPQQLRLTLQGAEPAKTPMAAPTALPALDITALMASLGGTQAVTPAPAATAAPAPVLPDLSGILGKPAAPAATANGGSPLTVAIQRGQLEGKLSPAEASLFAEYVGKNDASVRSMLAAKGVAV